MNKQILATSEEYAIVRHEDGRLAIEQNGEHVAWDGEDDFYDIAGIMFGARMELALALRDE